MTLGFFPLTTQWLKALGSASPGFPGQLYRYLWLVQVTSSPLASVSPSLDGDNSHLTEGL